ncbi:MAG: helix-turn-helix domain-containing GNAT family N-acetyltransferase [Burkholderiaceae bacterium]|nr:helix-turn-helix domain-containing GNAT family N-acetyltransferase [Burkholderiaceae bacterium]
MTTLPDTAERIAALRQFNRFYTRRIGVLHERLLDSRFSLAESRLLWELAHTEQTTATELAATLELDAGYLSRLLRGFKERGLVKAGRSPADARQTRLSITAAGRRAFAPLEQRQMAEVAVLLGPLSDAQQRELLAAMARIESLLGARARTQPFVLRAHRPGDIGWVVSRHGALYAQEYGWDQRFEALVARIAADFIERFDAAREACWIAERDGGNLGSVFLVQARDEATQALEPGTAQLRMLLVEPSARGLGLGVALVNQCERFARQAGYRRIRLWTNSLLLAARGIYQRAGYKLLASEPHHSFGHDLVGETWELELA